MERRKKRLKNSTSRTVFNQDKMEEKQSSLANEDEEHTAGMEEISSLHPMLRAWKLHSTTTPHMASMDDFFSMQGAEGRPTGKLDGVLQDC
jgi:hypothetical protein